MTETAFKRRRPPPTPTYAEGASDRFTERERPCARCGTEFKTTPKRRLLCERCFREHG